MATSLSHGTCFAAFLGLYLAPWAGRFSYARLCFIAISPSIIQVRTVLWCGDLCLLKDLVDRFRRSGEDHLVPFLDQGTLDEIRVFDQDV